MAIVWFVLFQCMSAGRRLAIIITPIIGGAASLMVPAVYNRFVNSFSERDIGSMDRLEALSKFPHEMSGNWWFGLGWGRPEFIDDVAAYKTNVVANSPLLTLYRGGIFPAIAFLLVLLAGTFLAYRRARDKPWESGFIGAVFVGFSLVGLQLDYPVVTIAPATMAWSVLIAFLAGKPEPRKGTPAAKRASDIVGAHRSDRTHVACQNSLNR